MNDEEMDLKVAEWLLEFDKVRYRIGDTPQSYLDSVYEIYDILRAYGKNV